MRPNKSLWLTALATAAIAYAGSYAMPALAAASAVGMTGSVLKIPLNKSQVLKLDRPYSRAMIGNPEIADVMPLTSGSVYVLGRKTGSTNLALYGRGGALIAVVDVQVAPDTDGLKRQLAETFAGEAVKVSASNDNIMLEGQVSSPITADNIMAMAETYAPGKVLNLLSVGSPQQVLLEVRISEMSRGTVRQLGINQATWANGGVARSAEMSNGPFSGVLTGLFGSTLDIQFEALERRGLVRTLANPNLVALSGETANFLAGGEFPIPSGVDNNGRVSIEFKQFGVALAFTPTVLGDGLINLRVAPEVSSIDREVTVDLDGTRIPGLKVRRAVTSLELRDGQSFAMAGLIQSDFSDTVREIPLLGRIPIIGALFRSTSFNKQETELVITVTPRIVRPVHPSQIRLPTDRVKEPGALDLFLLGETEKRVPMAPVSKPRVGGLTTESGHSVR